MAFCFYNLSSIFNGLVYFDQFSVLSKKQIALVLVGIVVLLAGVWIVSFPPTGGYSIDIGAWTAAEDEEEEESVPLLLSGQTSPAAESDSEDSDDEQHDDEPLPQPRHSRIRTRRSRSEDLRMDAVAPDQAGALPESQFQQHRRWITEPPAPVAPPSPSTPAPPRARRPRTESEAERSASARRSRSTYGTASPPPMFTSVNGTGSRRRRSTLATPPHASGTVPGQAALAGFSIGLSPVSPGFALVPTERRRRTMMGVVGTPEGIRRVVSEGGAARSRDVERIAGGDSEGVRGGNEGEGERQEGGEGGKTRGRWKWLGRVFAFAGPGAR